MIVAQPVLETPALRMLTYTLNDAKGARVIISVRSEIADDELMESCLKVLAAPSPAS